MILCRPPVEAASYPRIQRAQFRQKVSSTAALQSYLLQTAQLWPALQPVPRSVLQPHGNRSRVTTETAGRHRVMSSRRGLRSRAQHLPSTYLSLLSSPCFLSSLATSHWVVLFCHPCVIVVVYVSISHCIVPQCSTSNCHGNTFTFWLRENSPISRNGNLTQRLATLSRNFFLSHIFKKIIEHF